jgi:nicotinamidase-related amidase
MDFQPATLASVPSPDTLLARTQAALSWARSEKIQVCYVRVAFTDEDYRIYVLADATADPDPEVHRVLVDKVLPHQADVITTGDLPALTGESLKL